MPGVPLFYRWAAVLESQGFRSWRVALKLVVHAWVAGKRVLSCALLTPADSASQRPPTAIIRTVTA